MEELQIVAQQGQITFNLDGLKKEFQELAEKYKGIVFREEDIPIAKSDRARLNKIKTEIENKRKEIKKSWNEPYVAFEKQIKEVTEIISEPIGEIDRQLEEYENKRKAEKREHIKALFEENVGEYGEYISFDQVFTEGWLNKSTTDKDIISDISATVTKIRSDIDVIKALGSEIEDELLKAYKTSGELSQAIRRNQDYLQTKALAEQRVKEEQREEPKVREVVVDTYTGEELPSLTIQVVGEKNVTAVRDFLFMNDIDYKEI